MSIIINITVDDSISDVLASFDQIQIFRADVATEVFTEITTASTRITLDALDTLYTFTDSTGDGTKYYKTRYYNSSSTEAGPFSSIFLPTLALNPPSLGGMRVISSVQLADNMRILVSIDNAITDTIGTAMAADYEFFFYTKLTPMYCSYREIELSIGSFISDVPQDTVYLAIYSVSRGADALVVTTDNIGTDYFKYLRKRWVCCKTEETLLVNKLGGGSGLIQSKRLGDLSVTYNTDGIREAITRSVMCSNELLPLLQAGGSPQAPAAFVRGQYNPDTPGFGRGWIPTEVSGGIPAANTGRQRATNPFNPNHLTARRFAKTFTRGRIKWR